MKLSQGPRVRSFLFYFVGMVSVLCWVKPLQIAAQSKSLIIAVEDVIAGIVNPDIRFIKEHPKGPRAREQFNKGFSVTTADGTLKQIKSKWLRLVGQ